MALLAKGKPIMFAIRQEKAKEFIEESNKNVISQEFIAECERAAKLFKRK